MITVRWMDIQSDGKEREKIRKRKMKDGTIKEFVYKEKDKKTRKAITEFKDSLKKIPLPLRDIPKAYGIPMNKLSID